MRSSFAFLVTVVGLASVVVWSYWPAGLAAAERWSNDPQYSHGYLVPLFSLYMLWHRRAMLKQVEFGAVRTADLALGFGLLAVGLGLNWFGTLFFYNGLDLLSLVPALAGAMTVAGGRNALKWAWPGVGFLVFMVPLPFALQTALSGKLQKVATDMSTWTLQLLGAPAVAEGTTILINDTRIGVVEACSGLGMGVTFAALAAALVVIVRSPIWVKLGLLAGALPVAVLANVARITTTGLFYHANQAETARAVFHDLAGWLMMPVGLALLLGWRYVLDRILIDAGEPTVGDRGGPLPLLPRAARTSAAVK